MDMGNQYGGSGATGTTGAWSGGTTGTEDQGVLDQAQQKAGEVVEQVQEKAGLVAGQVRQQATTQLDQGRVQAGNTLEAVTAAIRQTGQQLREQDQGAIAQYADRAADQVERVYGYLGNRNVNEIINDVERLARREPALFLGAAFAVGLLAARFLKSSGGQAPGPGAGAMTGTRDWDRGAGYGGYAGSTGAGYGSQGYGYDQGDSARYGSQGGYSGAGSPAVISRGAGYGAGTIRSAGYGAGATGSSGYGAGITEDAEYDTGLPGTGTTGGQDYASDVTGSGTGYTSQIYGRGDGDGEVTGANGTGRASDATG